ncbi:hypothetical protein VNO78_23956 [Psophocarpus tetragonolobus]|uniref:Uncharacterized protein n=1 Tax=Psophocarpus tetragonolobus TaxID=3891 RepID=A0AAN9S7N3_PSOTE
MTHSTIPKFQGKGKEFDGEEGDGTQIQKQQNLVRCMEAPPLGNAKELEDFVSTINAIKEGNLGSNGHLVIVSDDAQDSVYVALSKNSFSHVEEQTYIIGEMSLRVHHDIPSREVGGADGKKGVKASVGLGCR